MGSNALSVIRATYRLLKKVSIIKVGVIIAGDHYRQQHGEAKPQAKEFVTRELHYLWDLDSIPAILLCQECVPEIWIL